MDIFAEPGASACRAPVAASTLTVVAASLEKLSAPSSMVSGQGPH